MKKNNSSSQRALSLFEDQGYNCAESILLTFLPQGEEELAKLATPFGGGIGKERDLCGILTGGVMVIGYFRGRTLASEVDKKKEAQELASDYYRWFEKQYGKACNDILPEDHFKGHADNCLDLIARAAEYLEQLLF